MFAVIYSIAFKPIVAHIDSENTHSNEWMENLWNNRWAGFWEFVWGLHWHEAQWEYERHADWKPN